MNKTGQRLRSSLAANVIGVIILALLLFGLIVTALVFQTFSDSFEKEFSTSSYYMADTATVMVNGDHIDDYLAGERTEEYQRTKGYMDTFCQRMNVSLIYVIKVDTSDYGSFVSVFDCVNNSADNTSFTEWEPGHRRQTGGESCRLIYEDLYEGDMPFGVIFNEKPEGGIKPYVTTIVPVTDSAGNTAALLCLQRPISEFTQYMTPYMIVTAIATLFLSLISGLVVTYFMRQRVVIPIRKVSEEATRFARENTIGEPLGGISRYDEISDLADSIDKMEADMVRYVEHLTEVTAERERMGAELSFASSIQENALPNVFPAFPDRKDFDIYASMMPAKEVGGDLYNFFLIDKDHLVMLIGDVSGKGVPAALFMMENNIIMSDRAEMGGTPAEILKFVNNRICRRNKTDMFITLWIGILNLATGKFVFANGGHEDAAVCRKGGSFELFKTKHNLVCGAIPNVPYDNFELQLEPGDKLFIYTDGVPEAADKDTNMFKYSRMLESLNRDKDGTPREILEGMHRSVKAFVGDAPQFDDLTMLCVEYLGKDGIGED